MKVNIQHSIDLGEVPLKVQDLYKNCMEQMNTLAQVSQTVSVLNPKDFLAKLDFIRQSLFALDNSLNECANIMSGFVTATEQLEDHGSTHTDHADIEAPEGYPESPVPSDFKTEFHPGEIDER